MNPSDRLEALQTLRNIVFFTNRLQQEIKELVMATGGMGKWPEAKQDQLSDFAFDKSAICKTLREINSSVTYHDLEQFLPKEN